MQAFQRAAVAAGLRRAMHVEVAHTSGGVAAYLAGYVAKNDRQPRRQDGSRLRPIGCSSDWPTARPGGTYRVGQVRREPDGTEPVPCARCERERAEAALVWAAAGSGEWYDRMRERNVRHWLRPAVDDFGPAGTTERLYEVRKEHYWLRSGTDGPGQSAPCRTHEGPADTAPGVAPGRI